MSNKKAFKQWYIKRTPVATILCLQVIFPNKDDLFYYAAVHGASPAYVEQVIEELNLSVNELEYNLSRIPVQVCAS